MEDEAYSKEPLKGKKEHTWFKKIGNSWHTDWNVYFDELSDDWKIIIDKFCNDLFNATSFSIKNAYVFRDVELHIRDEDKKAFLLEERKKVIEEIRNNKRHDWLEWKPSTVKDDDTLKLALKKAFWDQRSVFRTEYEQNISKNPDFKFESPSLVDYISNLKLLNYIDSWLNPQQTTKPIEISKLTNDEPIINKPFYNNETICTSLLLDLKDYISGEKKVFMKFINKEKLDTDEKLKWLKKKAVAGYFRTRLGIEAQDFNKYFELIGGKELNRNDKTYQFDLEIILSKKEYSNIFRHPYSNNTKV